MIILNLGDRIKNLRKENNLSQEQLAQKLNVSRQAISKWESNRAYPDIDNLVLLRNIFKVTLDDLVIGQDNIEGENNIEDVKNMDEIKDENNVEEENIYGSVKSDNDVKWYNVKLDKKDHEDEEDSDDDDFDTNLMVGGLIIGTAIGMITGDFMWATACSFIGMGVGYILKIIKK